MNVFRTATSQAIRDIIADHGTAHRFGISLTESDIEAICSRVVDLFEMTLNLRSQLGITGSEARQNSSEAQKKSTSASVRPNRWEEENASIPSTKAASELYDFSSLDRQSRSDSLPSVAARKDTAMDLTLPRKRIHVSPDEKETLLRRVQSPSAAQTQNS